MSTQFDEPVIEDRGELSVACIRRRVGMAQLPAFYDEAYPAIFGALEQAGVAPTGAPLGIIYGASADELDLAVAVPVGTGFADAGQVRVAVLPAAPTAVLTVKGDYAQLAGAHQYLQAWVAQQQREPLGWAWEQYVTEPQPGGDPAANITRIGVGLRG